MEENLVQAAKLGDKNAFIELMESFEKKLYVIARSRLDSEEDIKDVMQDTSIEVLSNIEDLKNTDSFNGWITQVLINKCNDILRNKNKSCYSCDELDDNSPILACEDEFIEIDNEIDLFSLIDFLTKEEQAIVVLYYSEGYTTYEIADFLNLNDNTVRTKMRRIKAKIKLKYGKEYSNDRDDRRYS